MKINLEKACIGFLIGILLFCVCNKMFLIEGVTMNTCRDNQCNGNKGCEDSCNEINLCYNPKAKVCTPDGNNAPKPKVACEAAGPPGNNFKWCGSGGQEETCDIAIAKEKCLNDPTITDCRTCVGQHQHESRMAGCTEKYIEDICGNKPPPGPAPGPTPPSPPGPDKFESGKITMEIVNNYGFKIIFFMRANNDWASSVNFDKQVNSCDNSGDWGCEPNTRYIILDDNQSFSMTFSNRHVIQSFKSWFFRYDNPDGRLNDNTLWIKKGSAGPQPGNTDFEFNLEGGKIDANVSYVDGINAKIDFYIYRNDSSHKVAENVCNFNDNPPLSQDFQRYNILGGPVIFASKYSLPDYPNDGTFKELNNASDWDIKNVLPSNKLDGCGNNPGDPYPPNTPDTNTKYQNDCRRHMAEKIQDPTSYCGYLMRAGCPYCWGLGEVYCIDPDYFNNPDDPNKTCEERVLYATKGPKALGCGYNGVNGINHFNWPHISKIGDPIPATSDGFVPFGGNPWPTSDMRGSTYWYNNDPSDTTHKRPTDFNPVDHLPDCKSPVAGNFNLGGVSLHSLHEIDLGQDAYYFRVEINSIKWLRLPTDPP